MISEEELQKIVELYNEKFPEQTVPLHHIGIDNDDYYVKLLKEAIEKGEPFKMPWLKKGVYL